MQKNCALVAVRLFYRAYNGRTWQHLSSGARLKASLMSSRGNSAATTEPEDERSDNSHGDRPAGSQPTPPAANPTALAPVRTGPPVARVRPKQIAYGEVIAKLEKLLSQKQQEVDALSAIQRQLRARAAASQIAVQTAGSLLQLGRLLGANAGNCDADGTPNSEEAARQDATTRAAVPAASGAAGTAVSGDGEQGPASQGAASRRGGERKSGAAGRLSVRAGIPRPRTRSSVRLQAAAALGQSHDKHEPELGGPREGSSVALLPFSLAWSPEAAAAMLGSLGPMTAGKLRSHLRRFIVLSGTLLNRVRGLAPDADACRRRLERLRSELVEHYALVLLARDPAFPPPIQIWLEPLFREEEDCGTAAGVSCPICATSEPGAGGAGERGCGAAAPQGPPAGPGREAAATGAVAGAGWGPARAEARLQTPSVPSTPPLEHWVWAVRSLHLGHDQVLMVSSLLDGWRARSEDISQRREQLLGYLASQSVDACDSAAHELMAQELSWLQEAFLVNYAIYNIAFQGCILTAEQVASWLLSAYPYVPSLAALDQALGEIRRQQAALLRQPAPQIPPPQPPPLQQQQQEPN